MDIQTILGYFQGAHGPKGEGYYECRCPVHDDRKSSLVIGPGEKGVRIKCLAGCRTEDVLNAVGLTMRDLFYDDAHRDRYHAGNSQPPQRMQDDQAATNAKNAQGERAEEKPKVARKIERVYPYCDEHGNTVFEVVRYKPKGFSQRVPDAAQKGGYRWSIKGVRPLIYRLPQVIDAIAKGHTVFVVEGEKDAETMAALGAAATTSPMGAGKWTKEHSAYLAGADVCVIPDNDDPGRMHADRVARQLLRVAKSVRILDIAKACRLPDKGDVSDMLEILGKADTVRKIRELMETTEPLAPTEEDAYERALEAYDGVSGYGVMDGGIVAYGKETVKRLSTFVALPTRIVTRDDGVSLEKYFDLEGWTHDGHRLPTVTVRADDFAGMGWVLRSWDFAANVMPGNTVREQLRYVMSEVGNRTARRETVYTHTGWRRINGKWAYLHRDGAIGAEDVRVELEGALRRYTFASGVEDDPQVAMSVAHGFVGCMARHVSVPLMGLAFLSPLREFLTQCGHMPRFAVWLKGPSNAHKSTVSSLCLSFFGEFGYADPLPASFHGTANSIRRKAFVLKDALLAVDDYHPETSLQERRKMDSLVQSLSRAYGNGDDRGRMNSDRKLEDSMPARGLALMSGEQCPDVGPSGVARFYIINIDKGDVDITPELEVMQEMAKKGYLRKAMADYILWLSGRTDQLLTDLPTIYTRLRARAMAEGGDAHGRSAEAVAHIMLGYEMMLQYMSSIGAMDAEDAQREIMQAWGVVMDNSRAQNAEAREDKPSSMFVSAVMQLLASKQATVVDITAPSAGAVPNSTIGYCDQQYYYLLPDVTFSRVCRMYTDQGVVFPFGKRALFKALRDEGLLSADSDGKASRVKRIGANAMRLLWFDRARLEASQGLMEKSVQMSMTAVEDDEDNPF